MASLYFNNAIDTSLNTLGNWWQDAGGTIPAVALPGPGDIAEADGVTIDSGTCNAGTFYFNAALILGGTHHGTGTINNGYLAGGTFHGFVIIQNGVFVDAFPGPTFTDLVEFNGDGDSYLQGGTFNEIEFTTTGNFTFNAAHPTYQRIKLGETWFVPETAPGTITITVE